MNKAWWMVLLVISTDLKSWDGGVQEKYTFFSSGLAEVRVALSRYGVIMEEKEG